MAAFMVAKSDLCSSSLPIQNEEKEKGAGNTGFQRNKPSWIQTNENLLSTNRKAGNLNELSSLGHFLKGSSATLGFTKIQENCQIIQQYGHRLTTESTPEDDEEVCLNKISEALEKAKVDTEELQKRMMAFFGLLDTNIH